MRCDGISTGSRCQKIIPETDTEGGRNSDPMRVEKLCRQFCVSPIQLHQRGEHHRIWHALSTEYCHFASQMCCNREGAAEDPLLRSMRLRKNFAIGTCTASRLVLSRIDCRFYLNRGNLFVDHLKEQTLHVVNPSLPATSHLPSRRIDISHCPVNIKLRARVSITPPGAQCNH